MGRRFKFEKHETPLNPQDSSLRQRTNDWTGSVHEPRMVLFNHSNRPDHDCVYHLNLRRAQDASLLFHPRGSDAITIDDNLPPSELDKVDTCVGEVLFERNHPDLNQAGGDS